MKILFVQKRILFPTDAGMKIRTLNVVRYLARWHDVTYLCNVDDADEPHLGQMRSLGLRLETVPWRETRRGTARFYGELLWNLVSPYPYNVAKDYDARLRQRATELLADHSYDLVVCDFVQMAENVSGLTMSASLLFQHNVEAEIFRRMALVGSFPRRAYIGHQHQKMKRYEAEAGRRFDRVVAVSDRDRAAFERDYGWPHVRTIDTAVDTEHFRPADTAEMAGRLVFVGSLDWLPNEEGVRWFVEQVWPRIRAKQPEATFQIVGRHPTASLARIAEVPGVELVGTVPDVRPHFGESQIVIVPLLTGGGTRLKIFEAMAMRKATVSTTLGAEGLPLTPGEHLLIADDAESFAAAVLNLLSDDVKRRTMATAAFDLVTQSYTADAVARQFEAICFEAAGSATPTVTAGTCTA